MDTPELRRSLAERLTPERLRVSHGAPFAVQVPQGPVLEFRYLAQLDLLCVAAAAGRLIQVTRAETWRELMQANLFLADAGLPHWALGQDDTVLLCCTLSVDAAAPERLLDELMRLLALRDAGREQLLAMQLAT
jgi:hypothetical protein